MSPLRENFRFLFRLWVLISFQFSSVVVEHVLKLMREGPDRRWVCLVSFERISAAGQDKNRHKHPKIHMAEETSSPVADVVHQGSNLYTELVLVVHVEQGLVLLDAIYNDSGLVSHAKTMLKSSMLSSGKPEAGVPELLAPPQPLELPAKPGDVSEVRAPVVTGGHAHDDCIQIRSSKKPLACR